MDVDDIMQKQVEQLEKEKKELGERLRNQEKKVCVYLSVWFVCLYNSDPPICLDACNYYSKLTLMLYKHMSYCS